jgi:hypothetical protein
VPLVLSDPTSEPAEAIVEIAQVLDAIHSAGFTKTLPLVG